MLFFVQPVSNDWSAIVLFDMKGQKILVLVVRGVYGMLYLSL
jgi:hypothetical protein